MTQTTSAPAKAERILGAVCWNELHTRDLERARAFYEKVVGWRTFDSPPDEKGQGYTEWIRPDGAHVGGMMTLPPEVPAQVPSSWACYINVDDIESTVAHATKLGGKTVVPPFDVPNVGRLAGIADPSGAIFYLMKGIGKCGERVPQTTTGSFCWMELLTSDPAACAKFYCALFGWTTTVMNMPGMDYTLFWLAGADKECKQGGIGGMMKIPAEWGSMPSNWLPYIMVDDVDAATERATNNGGTVACAPMDIPNVGRCSVSMDPTGATFALFTGVSN